MSDVIKHLAEHPHTIHAESIEDCKYELHQTKEYEWPFFSGHWRLLTWFDAEKRWQANHCCLETSRRETEAPQVMFHRAIHGSRWKVKVKHHLEPGALAKAIVAW